MPGKSDNGYGERMARIETTLDYVKTEIAGTKKNVDLINQKLDALIANQLQKEENFQKECDARYASKRIETAFWAGAAILGAAFVGALIYVVAIHPMALTGG
jgi:hypothetical protein